MQPLIQLPRLNQNVGVQQPDLEPHLHRAVLGLRFQLHVGHLERRRGCLHVVAISAQFLRVEAKLFNLLYVKEGEVLLVFHEGAERTKILEVALHAH